MHLEPELRHSCRIAPRQRDLNSDDRAIRAHHLHWQPQLAPRRHASGQYRRNYPTPARAQLSHIGFIGIFVES
jgi:hypothetical protein